MDSSLARLVLAIARMRAPESRAMGGPRRPRPVWRMRFTLLILVACAARLQGEWSVARAGGEGEMPACRGLVLGAAGVPVAGCRVAAFAEDVVLEAAQVARWQPLTEAAAAGTGLTNDHGRFSVAVPLSGRYVLVAVASGYGRTLLQPVAAAGGVRAPSVVLNLEPVARRAGRVVDATGAGVAGADVLAFLGADEVLLPTADPRGLSPQFVPLRCFRTRTDNRGDWQIVDGVAPEGRRHALERVIVVERGLGEVCWWGKVGDLSESACASVRTGGSSAVTLRWDASSSVCGRVRAEVREMVGDGRSASVVASLNAENSQGLRVRLPAGFYRMLISARASSGGRLEGHTDVLVREGGGESVVDVELRGIGEQVVEGVVVGVGGAPQGGVTVRLADVGWPKGDAWRVSDLLRAVTDGVGRFGVRGYVGSLARIVVDCPEGTVVEAPADEHWNAVVVESGRETEVRLASAAAVRGRVLSEGGAGLVGGVVRCSRSRWMDATYAVTGEGGEFLLPREAHGRCELQALDVGTGRLSETVSLVVERGEHEVTLRMRALDRGSQPGNDGAR